MTTPSPTVHILSVEALGAVDLTVTVEGAGHEHPFLLLHGGAGPRSMSRLAGLLAETERALVIAPTHPGFDGTPRPQTLGSVRDLARLYRALLDDLGLTDVTVIQPA